PVLGPLPGRRRARVARRTGRSGVPSVRDDRRASRRLFARYQRQRKREGAPALSRQARGRHLMADGGDHAAVRKPLPPAAGARHTDPDERPLDRRVGQRASPGALCAGSPLPLAASARSAVEGPHSVSGLLIAGAASALLDSDGTIFLPRLSSLAAWLWARPWARRCPTCRPGSR